MGKTRHKNRIPPSANGAHHAAPLAAVPPTFVPPSATLKLDLGCGPNCRDGFEGADVLPFGGKVKHVLDLRTGRWPWADGSVAEVHSAHFLEHLTNLDEKYERVHFFNELYRILAPVAYDGAGKPTTGFATIILPHWCSQRYYGDPSHKEPFSEFALYYLLKDWRANNAPHTDAANVPWGYSCDLDSRAWYNVHQSLATKNPEAQQMALTCYKEMATDLLFHCWRKS